MSQPGGMRGQSPAELQVAKVSDTGRARPHNEDYADLYIPRDAQELATKGAIYLVADGMGGHQAGEVASRAAVELVMDQYYRDVEHDVGTSLVRAIRTANRAIYEQAQSDLSKGGMGTTLVAAVVVGPKVYIASVGDSRVYLIGPDRISQITEDHSWVQEQVRAGLLTPEQARQHPQRNVVTRALGSKPAVEVDLFEGQLGEGDALLMCSDGLSGLVEDREIQMVVASQPPAEAARTLVAMANERGGADNITVLILNNRPDLIPAAAPILPLPAAPTVPAAAAAGGKSGRRVPWPAIAVGIVLLLALAAAIVFVLLRSGGAATETATPTVPPPTGTEVQSPLSTPVPTPTLDLGGTVVPVALTVAPGSPTVTLIPTRTSTPSATPGAAHGQATARQPTAPPALIHPAPRLVAPLAQDAGSVHGVVRFRWQYDRSLLPGEQFQVLIWRDGTFGSHLGAAGYTRATQQDINLDDVLPERGGPGKYWWSVVVLQVLPGGKEQRLSPEAAPWNFTFIEVGPTPTQSPTGPAPAPPTATHTPLAFPTSPVFLSPTPTP